MLELNNRTMETIGTIFGSITIQGVTLDVKIDGAECWLRYPETEGWSWKASERQIAFLVQSRKQREAQGKKALEGLLVMADKLDQNYDEVIKGLASKDEARFKEM